MSLLYEIYDLCFDEDVIKDIDDVLKSIEKFLNNNKNITSEESEIFDEIIKKVKLYENEFNEKRIKKIIDKYEAIIEKQNETNDDDIEIETESELENELDDSPLILSKPTIRTDISIIPTDTISIVKDSYNLFKELIYEEKQNCEILNEYFKNPKTTVVNLSVKNKYNLYTLDRYGLIIRRKEFMKKKKLFAWKFDKNNEPIHYLTNPDICNDEENVKAVLNAQFLMNEKAFNPTGVIYKVYSKYYPERLALFGIYI